jgi:hypothetical protein
MTTACGSSNNAAALAPKVEVAPPVMQTDLFCVPASLESKVKFTTNPRKLLNLTAISCKGDWFRSQKEVSDVLCSNATIVDQNLLPKRHLYRRLRRL